MVGVIGLTMTHSLLLRLGLLAELGNGEFALDRRP